MQNHATRAPLNMLIETLDAHRENRPSRVPNGWTMGVKLATNLLLKAVSADRRQAPIAGRTLLSSYQRRPMQRRWLIPRNDFRRAKQIARFFSNCDGEFGPDLFVSFLEL